MPLNMVFGAQSGKFFIDCMSIYALSGPSYFEKKFPFKLSEQVILHVQFILFWILTMKRTEIKEIVP